MDFASSTEACRGIEDNYTLDLHEDDGLTLCVTTLANSLNVVQSYLPNKKKTLFVVEVHVNQEKFWHAKVDLPGHEANGEIVRLATHITSFANDFAFEFDELVTIEGSQSELNDGRLHDFIVHGNNIREVFWDKFYRYMTRSIHNIAIRILRRDDIKPSKITVILEIGVTKYVDVPYDHRGEKIMQRNLPCSSLQNDDEFEMDKKFEKDGIDDVHCPICHYELVHGANITRMPCSHLFHTKCLSKWLSKHNTCPLCRSPMRGPDGSIYGDVKEANGSIHGNVSE